MGRSRLLAHWSVLRTLLRFQRPARMQLVADGQAMSLKTPLIFIARSAYQLERFGLEGAKAISDDKLVAFVARGGSRWHLVKLALRLALRRVQAGRDVDLITAHEIDIATAKRRPKVAFDGERRRMLAPLSFRIEDQALSIIVPDAVDRVSV